MGAGFSHQMCFSDFPGHFRLMLLAARSPLSSSDREQIRQTLKEQIEWNEFLRVVQAHRLAPLVLVGLTAAAAEYIPDFVNASLSAISKANSNRVVRSILETQRIARTFQRQGFQITVLKGALLSELIYGDPFRRYSVDVDLLTSKEQLAQQVHCMEELGYELVMPYCRLTPRRIRSYSHYRKDFSFKHRRSGMMVDLHWRLFNNPEHPGNLLGANRVPIQGKLFGDGLYMLPRIDQFLYCAAHGVSDAWIYLKSLADFAAFSRTLTPQDMQEAVIRSDEIKLLSKLSSATHIAHDWMGSPAFDKGLLPANDPLHVTMYRNVVETLQRSHFSPDRADIDFSTEFRLERLLVPGIKGTLNVAGRYLFRPRVWSAVDLPDQFFWLYALLGLLTPPRLSKSDRP
jgi:hypothetical protein